VALVEDPRSESVVGLGTLVAMELEAPQRTSKAVSEPLAPSTVALSASRDTLNKADRLETPFVKHEAPAQPISSVERMPPPDPAAIIPKERPKFIDQHKRGAVAVMLPTPRPKHAASKRPKHAASNKTANTEHPKLTADVKSCRPNLFDRLLKALNLSPGCET
jgi:hypothetical protein